MNNRRIKIMLDIINTILTVVISFIIFGFIGVIISFLPDIMLIYIVSDLWQKNTQDKLLGFKGKLHLYLHSYRFLATITFIILLFVIVFINELIIVDIILRILLIIYVHIFLDHATHSKKYNRFFEGYM